MGRCARAALLLLPHVNLLLALYGGAGLATSARLKWDPSTYVVVRELFPLEYRVAAVLLTVVSLVLVLLGHVAAAALASTRIKRRILFYVYGLMMIAVVACEVAFAWWVGVQVATWLGSEQAQILQESLEIRHHVQPILQFLGKWHPLPQKIQALVQEAEADLPRNGYVAAVATALLLLLQALAATFALIGASSESRHQPLRSSDSSEEGEEARLKVVYANGRLVMVPRSARRAGYQRA